MTTDKYEVGDILRLRSGGPMMTCLVSIYSYSSDDVVICQWFDEKGVLHLDKFSSKSLINDTEKQRVEKEKQKKTKEVKDKELDATSDEEVPF